MSDLPFGNIFDDPVDSTPAAATPAVQQNIINNAAPAFSKPLVSPTSSIPSASVAQSRSGSAVPFVDIDMSKVGSLTDFGTPKSSDSAITKDEDFKFDAIFGEMGPEIGIGAIKRIVPIGEWLLETPAVKALKRKLDEIGVTDAMPTVYANRVKHNIQKGYVTADGSGFTEKGQQRAAEYLQYRYNKSSDEAMKRASAAKSVKIDQKRGEKAQGLNLKFAFGYQLDTVGRAVRH